MKNIGIWLDKKKAHIVYVENNDDKMITVLSEVEDYHVVGGSGSKTKWGPQQVVHDSKYTEREKHQLKIYFKEIIRMIDDADAIAIFGPADTNVKLEKEIRLHHKQLAKKIIKVEKADSMTINQIKAMVKDFFK